MPVGSFVPRERAGAQVTRRSTPCACHGTCSRCAPKVAGNGLPLPQTTQREMSAAFGFDFGSVRVHADDEAAAAAQRAGARAFTLGSDVVFGRDAFAPASPEGRRLLAHELTHVVQQARAPVPVGQKAERTSSPSDPAESEARRAADAVVRGERPVVGAAGDGRTLYRETVASCDCPGQSISLIGERAHKAVQGWCSTQNPFCFSELEVEGAAMSGSGNSGYADLFHFKPGSTLREFGEIKPVSQAQDIAPFEQLFNYMTEYKARHPDHQTEPMSWVPMPPQNGLTPFGPDSQGNEQYLNASAPTNGVYYYWCTKQQKPNDWVPVPVAVPKEVLDRIRQRIRELRDRLIGTPAPAPAPAPARSIPWGWIALGVVVVVAAAAVIVVSGGTTAPVVAEAAAAALAAILAAASTAAPAPAAIPLAPAAAPSTDLEATVTRLQTLTPDSFPPERRTAVLGTALSAADSFAAAPGGSADAALVREVGTLARTRGRGQPSADPALVS